MCYLLYQVIKTIVLYTPWNSKRESLCAQVALCGKFRRYSKGMRFVIIHCVGIGQFFYFNSKTY